MSDAIGAEIMNLYLFPEAPVLDNGYGLGVYDAYKKMNPLDDDLVVWFTNVKNIPHRRLSDIVVKKAPLMSFFRIRNFLLGRPTAEIVKQQLSFLKDMEFNKIYCDDTVFYRAIRALFPDKEIVIRFSDCCSRIKDRKRLLGINIGLRHELVLDEFYNLEKTIFSDKKAKKIFITEQDKDYYCILTGKSTDAEVWKYVADIELIKKNRNRKQIKNKIVWFGGISSHKKKSVQWFRDKVFPELQKKIPDIEFHLWGKKTMQFNCPSKKIYAHGYYNGNDIPLAGEALFINPDIIGEGIKVKLMKLLEMGLPFISTPFGFEGYDNELIDNEYCYVCAEEDWVQVILSILLHQKEAHTS